MTNRLAITVTGITPLIQKLHEIRESKARKALRAGMNEATKAINREVKDALKSHKRTGTLEKSIGRKVKTYEKQDAVVGIVGPRKEFLSIVLINGKPTVVDPVNYMHLVEYGTSHSPGYFILNHAESNNKALFLRETEIAAKREILNASS